MVIRKNGQTASVRTRRIINKFGPNFVVFDNKNDPDGYCSEASRVGLDGSQKEK